MRAFTRTNLLLLLTVAALAVVPLAAGLGSDRDEPYTGSDQLAQERITEDHPNYRPWFHSLYTPPSGEIESALFALQAALGAGVIGYYFGVATTRRRLARPAEAAASTSDADPPGPS